MLRVSNVLYLQQVWERTTSEDEPPSPDQPQIPPLLEGEEDAASLHSSSIASVCSVSSRSQAAAVEHPSSRSISVKRSASSLAESVASETRKLTAQDLKRTNPQQPPAPPPLPPPFVPPKDKKKPIVVADDDSAIGGTVGDRGSVVVFRQLTDDEHEHTGADAASANEEIARRTTYQFYYDDDPTAEERRRNSLAPVNDDSSGGTSSMPPTPTSIHQQQQQKQRSSSLKGLRREASKLSIKRKNLTKKLKSAMSLKRPAAVQ